MLVPVVVETMSFPFTNLNASGDKVQSVSVATAGSVFVVLQWSMVDRSKLDQRTLLPLPLERVALGSEFDLEGQRWRMVAVGNAKDLGFKRVPAERSAYVCAPVGHLLAP
jgi:hypothetical protein